MVSMVLVINSTPLNCQMQSTRILLTGGESEISDISVLSVANVVSESDPDKPKVTTLSGKFVATK